MVLNIEMVGLLLGAYAISIPVAYVIVPILRLGHIFPSKDIEPTWGMATLWPVFFLVALYLIPAQLIGNLHDKVDQLVQEKTEEEKSADPPEPNPVPYEKSKKPRDKSFIVINGKTICPYCRHTLRVVPDEDGYQDGYQNSAQESQKSNDEENSATRS